AMHAAAQALVGLHDFTTFRDVNCQSKSPEKTLDVARVSRVGEEVHLVFEARSFLHRQVRSMTGTLAEVGLGRWSVADVAAALAARDRTACGPVAPPDGPSLTGARYCRPPPPPRVGRRTYRRAEFELEVTASPAADTSRPIPAMVLQAETARAAAMTVRVTILRMSFPRKTIVTAYERQA